MTLSPTPSILISRFRESERASNILNKFLSSQVKQRRAEIRRELEGGGGVDSGRKDIFSLLVHANEHEGEKFPLDDQELVRQS